MSTERIDTERAQLEILKFIDDLYPEKGVPKKVSVPRNKLRKWAAALDQERSDAAALRERISQLEGELAGIALMDAEGQDFLPEYVKQLEERIRLLEQAAWWNRMSAEDIAAELSGTFDLGLPLTRRIAEWILQTSVPPESPAAASGAAEDAASPEGQGD